MRFARTTSLAAALAALTLAACGDDEGGDRPKPAADANAAPRVTVKTFMFDPDPVEVERGTQVTWVNEDATVHTVTTGPRRKPDGRIDKRLKPSGGRFTTSFDKPGTYRYFCSLHSGPGMEAEVVVK